jgi:hypothetical protein
MLPYLYAIVLMAASVHASDVLLYQIGGGSWDIYDRCPPIRTGQNVSPGSISLVITIILLLMTDDEETSKRLGHFFSRIPE